MMDGGGRGSVAIEDASPKAAMSNRFPDKCTSFTNISKIGESTRFVRALPFGLCTRSNTRVREANRFQIPQNLIVCEGNVTRCHALSPITTATTRRLDDSMTLPLFASHKVKKKEEKRKKNMDKCSIID